MLHPDRLLPADEPTRSIARQIYSHVKDLPIISPHGHVPAQWLADNRHFDNPTSLLLTPDHYTNRLLHSIAGIDLADLGVPVGSPITQAQARTAFRLLCAHWKYLAGTSVRSWFEAEFADVFGLDVIPSEDTADHIYDHIAECLETEQFRPRALYERFNISLLATTDDPCSDLDAHQRLDADPTWHGRVVPTFRPDAYLEPARPGFSALIDTLGHVADTDTRTYAGHVEAMRVRRQYFKDHGAISSDHSHADPGTQRLSDQEAEYLYRSALAGTISPSDGDRLRRHMINDQARLACEDGLVMTMHPSVYRNHDQAAYERFGADIGGDIPASVEFTRNLQPLLSAYGNHPNFHLILFTIDETVYSRELAPLAGYYRGVYVGAPWWFIDEADAMARFRSAVTGYAGFYKTSGFVDDTRAFCSIPARHDLSRRVDAGFLAGLVSQHRVEREEAIQIAQDLVTTIPERAFNVKGSRENG